MSIKTDLVAAFEPWMTDDLQDYLEVIGDMFAELELYTLEWPDPERPGSESMPAWGTLLDPDLCPPKALPYLAQYVGERLPVGLTEAQQRAWIKDHPNQRRGTLESIARVGQRTLTGTKLITIIERSDGTAGDHPDDLVVITYDDQTPNPAQVESDLVREVIPYDITLHYQHTPGATWQQLSTNYASWTAVKDHYTDWGQVAADRTGGIVYGS
jgi:hypothetical protein